MQIRLFYSDQARKIVRVVEPTVELILQSFDLAQLELSRKSDSADQNSDEDG